jgi:hypothetical protein
VEEENSPPYLEDVVIDSKEERINLENITLLAKCTRVHNEFQRPTNGTWLNSICPEQSLTTPLKLKQLQNMPRKEF